MLHAFRSLPIQLTFIMSLIWIPLNNHAAQVSDDLPPVGHSRFDQLVGSAPVPYPFARLVKTLNQQMLQDLGGLPALKITLIPLGRSLQRNAGAPDFFRFPRVVAAADGNNRPGVAPLKDRLFLGYHEKGNVLEVISYNDDAGRFEFQVVRDYAAGKTPQVYYARRSLCMACHQNAAPIFARPLWDETPANPAIAKKLRATRQDFYGVKITGTDIAYFIDASTERANLFSVWQTLWQQGCGEGEIGDRCRMEAFSAALDYARSKKLPADTAFPTLDRNWTSRWPHGLAIPNPDLPNRNPLDKLQFAANDPLLLRQALTTWTVPDKTAFIVGLAGMLDTAAIKQLGRRDVNAALENLRTRGELVARPFGPEVLMQLLAELGDRPKTIRSSKLPPQRTEPIAQTTSGTLARFRTHCASCHDTTLPHPPNFLHGAPAQIEANLDQCAARIFVRLSMAEKPESSREISPMPPASALLSQGIPPQIWVKSAEFFALKHSIESRLHGKAPALLQQAYATLPPCLTHDAYAVHAP